jgi:hypothetical protein
LRSTQRTYPKCNQSDRPANSVFNQLKRNPRALIVIDIGRPTTPFTSLTITTVLVTVKQQ